MTVIDKAKALLSTQPIPDDALEQMEKLAAEAGEEEKAQFNDLFEGLVILLNQDLPTPKKL